MYKRLAVTSPSFCASPSLMEELTQIPQISISSNSAGTRFNEKSLVEFLRQSEAEIAIIGMEPITASVLAQCPNLKIICKYGVGLDNLDLESMKAKGIQLGWTGGVNKRSVAELVLSFALGHARNVFCLVDQMQKGVWQKKGGVELSHQTVGIVGFGHIGKEVAHLLKAFGCPLLVTDIFDKSQECQEIGAHFVDYKTLLSESQVITFHVPLTEQTKNMYDASHVAITKNQALIINTSRGEVIHFPSVVEGVKSHKLGGYASDVFPEEPLESNEYSVKDHFYFTSHIGGNSQEAVLAMGRSAIHHVKQYLSKEGF